jgi:hypothetical protein
MCVVNYDSNLLASKIGCLIREMSEMVLGMGCMVCEMSRLVQKISCLILKISCLHRKFGCVADCMLKSQ